MDEKDLRIADLEGQVKAYQEQLRSAAIELLRVQFERLKERQDTLERSSTAASAQHGLAIGAFEERLTKASAAFVELRKEVSELKKGQKAEVN